MNSFDVIVIGAGPGGYVAAIRAAQKGLTAAVIESGDVGGTCLNRGCIPTKTMLHSAHLFSQIKNSGLFGITGSENVGIDFAKINDRKNEVVVKLRAGTERLLTSAGVKIFRGRALIQDANTVTVAGAELTAKNIIIATGSAPNRLPESMQAIENVITSDEALSEDATLFKRVLIIGGGVIGVEFAGMYNGLGCEVTVVDSVANLISRMDADISKNLMKLFVKRGIKVITPATVQSIQKTENGLTSVISHKGKEIEIETDGVLVCVGRSPKTDLGILFDGRGFISVDENMRTGIPNIYAIGDCAVGGSMLAHAASAQGLNVISHILGEPPAVNMTAIPACVYSNPEIASVGLTAAEAEANGIEIKIGKYLMTGNGKSIITNEDRGFIKLVFDAGTNVIIGAHLMCARATDIIGELANAVANKQTAEELASVIRPHPTYMEGVTEAAESLFGLSIHTEKMHR